MGESTVDETLVPSAADKAYSSASAGGVDWQSLGAPVLADVDRIVTVLNPIADGALTVAAQPDVPRNVTVDIVDADDSSSGTCTVKGTDINGLPLVETFSWTEAGQIVGVELFENVASAVVSDEAGAASGDTITVGVGNLIALPKQIANVEAVKLVTFAAVPVTADAVAATPRSSVDANGATYDGSSELKVAYRPGQ